MYVLSYLATNNGAYAFCQSESFMDLRFSPALKKTHFNLRHCRRFNDNTSYQVHNFNNYI